MATWIRVRNVADETLERAPGLGSEGAARQVEVPARELPQGVEWRGFDLSDLMVFATLGLALSGMFGGFSI